MASPESSTAALTACSACAARGISADRVTWENPTPLTATLHLFSHMRQISFATTDYGASDASRNCGSVMSSFSGWKTTSTRRPTFASVYGSLQQIAGQQCPGRVVELHDDARVGDGRGKSPVTGVVHDRVGVDAALAADGLELEVDGHAVHTGRVRGMLEVPASLAALQRQHALLGRFPEGLCPLVRDGNRPASPCSSRSCGPGLSSPWP